MRSNALLLLQPTTAPLGLNLSGSSGSDDDDDQKLCLSAKKAKKLNKRATRDDANMSI